jgi:hypothetical protein
VVVLNVLRIMRNGLAEPDIELLIELKSINVSIMSDVLFI